MQNERNKMSCCHCHHPRWTPETERCFNLSHLSLEM